MSRSATRTSLNQRPQPETRHGSRAIKILLLLVLVLLVVFFQRGSGHCARGPTQDPWVSNSYRLERSALRADKIRLVKRKGRPRERGREGMSSEEMRRLEKERRKWESLPPEKQRILRERMEEWKRLSPQDRELFRQRFDQWQRLTPDERQRIRRKLENWDMLPLQERERIRREFITP